MFLSFLLVSDLLIVRCRSLGRCRGSCSSAHILEALCGQCLPLPLLLFAAAAVGWVCRLCVGRSASCALLCCRRRVVVCLPLRRIAPLRAVRALLLLVSTAKSFCRTQAMELAFAARFLAQQQVKPATEHCAQAVARSHYIPIVLAYPVRVRSSAWP